MSLHKYAPSRRGVCDLNALVLELGFASCSKNPVANTFRFKALWKGRPCDFYSMPAILIDPAIRPAIGRWPHIKMSAKYFDQFVRPTTPVSLNTKLCQRPRCRDLQRCGPEAVVAYIETKHERLRSEKRRPKVRLCWASKAGWTSSCRRRPPGRTLPPQSTLDKAASHTTCCWLTRIGA